MIMNWKWFGSKRPWPNFKVLSRNSPGGTEKNNEERQPVTGDENRALDLPNTKQISHV
jgi:hypothetical protein